MLSYFIFFNDTATTEIYTLSLHDALPICQIAYRPALPSNRYGEGAHVITFSDGRDVLERDRKSTRLNSSHANISNAVFCLKKKITNSSTLVPTTPCMPSTSSHTSISHSLI